MSAGSHRKGAEGERDLADVELRLAPVADAQWASVPVDVRLRRLLKIALRTCGLRAVRIAAPGARSPQP